MALDYAEGDTFYAADVDNIIEAAEKNGVLTGWGIVENGTPNMSVNVQLGTGFAGGTYNTTVGDTNVIITASHASLNRIDLIVVNNSGTFSAVAGTPAATPNPADLPDNSIILAQVYIGATVTTILNANITQKGILLGTIAKEMVSTDIALRTQAQTITGNWIHSGTVNYQNNIKLESQKKIEFCYTGSTVASGIYADTADRIRIESNVILGSGYLINWGDGVDLCGKIGAFDTYFLITDVDENIAIQIKANEGTAIGSDGISLPIISTIGGTVQIIVEATSSTGGIFPAGSEQGGSGGTNSQWQAMWSKFIYTSGGAHGSYSQRQDMADLKAIKEYRDEEGNPLRTTEHGDPVWDMNSFPEYLRDKSSIAFRSKQQILKTQLPDKSRFTKRKLKPKTDQIIEAAPEMAYLNVSYVQGWFISLLKKFQVHNEAQDKKLDLALQEIHNLKNMA